MKTQIRLILAAIILSTLNLQLSTCFAQDTTFTYQGRVTDNGTNFNGSGQFEFALVTSTNANSQATATANAPSGGYITGYTVTYGGNGYTGSTVPLTISGGGGSGAAAHGNISGGAVTSITVDNPGNGGYNSPPTVTIDAPPANITYTTYWSNDGTSDGEPSAAVNVSVNSGLFTVTLGDTNTANMAPIDSSLFAQPDLQLRIWFNDGVNGFAALTPLQNLTPAPYAVNAMFANSASGLTIQQNADDAPNVVLGSFGNFVQSGVEDATIGGGGTTDYLGVGFISINSVTGDFGTISGGDGNTASYTSTVGGGQNNTASGGESAIGGGINNTANGQWATVGGGEENHAGGERATVGGGDYNTASDEGATVGGGDYNTASDEGATVGGGSGNTASGYDATVPGGAGNIAGGELSFAAGENARATNDGAFVWGDASGNTTTSTNDNSVTFRASGGYRLFTSGGNAGVSLAAGATSWATISDQNAKKNFAPVNGETVLDKLAQVPVEKWNYKWEKNSDTPNIGPMAQAFKAAFYPGRDNKSITTLEFDGVELAAIQGLNEKLNEKDAVIQTLEQQNDLLAKRLNKLEATVKSLANK